MVSLLATMTERIHEVRWHLGDDIDAFLRITEPTSGDRVLWVRNVRDGSMFPLTPDGARRLGQALLDYAASVSRAPAQHSPDPSVPPVADTDR
jgi:hypothetical protein